MTQKRKNRLLVAVLCALAIGFYATSFFQIMDAKTRPPSAAHAQKHKDQNHGHAAAPT